MTTAVSKPPLPAMCGYDGDTLALGGTVYRVCTCSRFENELGIPVIKAARIIGVDEKRREVRLRFAGGSEAVVGMSFANVGAACKLGNDIEQRIYTRFPSALHSADTIARKHIADLEERTAREQRDLDRANTELLKAGATLKRFRAQKPPVAPK